MSESERVGIYIYDAHAAVAPPPIASHMSHSHSHPSSLQRHRRVWNQGVSGFTTHTFSQDFTQLTTTYVTYENQFVRNFTITKGQRYVPAAVQN